MSSETQQKMIEIHPAANIIPKMTDEEFAELKEDISGLGLREPIVLFQGKILDGRHRYRACVELGIEPHFRPFEGGTSPGDFVMSTNVRRRQLTPSQKAMAARNYLEYSRISARQRQREAGDKNLKQFKKSPVRAPVREPVNEKIIEFPGATGKAAEAAAKVVGVSPRSVESANYIAIEGTDEDIKDVETRKATVKAKEREVRQRKHAQAEKPRNWITVEQWSDMDEEQRKTALGNDGKTKFNPQKNGKIEWAQWSWNPVTGCLHNCSYCYARDIAEKIYPQKFAPALIPERLSAPENTKQPVGATGVHRNVFACSMADLFGKWVPEEWISLVLDSIRAAPQWNFLLLTKFPKRLLDFEFPDNAWVGTTVDRQLKVRGAEDVFGKVRAKTKFLSVEPMLENLQFQRLDLFSWVIVGGASKSTKTPEWIPPFDWLASIHRQARAADCAIYLKTNLKLPDELRLVELPWIDNQNQKIPESF